MSQETVWCAKCHLRIAPFERRTVYQKVDYHQQCFLKLVRDEAEQQRAARNTGAPAVGGGKRDRGRQMSNPMTGVL
jgi:hypothetical protein